MQTYVVNVARGDTLKLRSGPGTTVLAGALYVNGDQTAATGATTVLGGATLGGTGTVGGNVTIGSGGTLAPGGVGGTIGTLTITGGSVQKVLQKERVMVSGWESSKTTNQ